MPTRKNRETETMHTDLLQEQQLGKYEDLNVAKYDIKWKEIPTF